MERRVEILGTGAYLPPAIITSAELDTKLGLPAGSIERKTGVSQRHAAGAGETAASMAAQACRAALEKARVKLDEIDCLISASGTMDQGLPHNAALVHRALGLIGPNIPAIDVNSSCLSFLVALDTFSWPLALGRYKKILIVSSDLASPGLDWNHLESSAIFGDGAAAAVIGAAGEGTGSRILASNLITCSEGSELCKIPGLGSRFHPNRTGSFSVDPMLFKMEGKRVYKMAAELLPGFVQNLMEMAKTSLSEIACVIPHQGSALGLHHLTKMLGLEAKRVIDIFRDHGNQVGASLPTALHTALSQQRLKRGDKALLIGFGAGISVGGMVLEY